MKILYLFFYLGLLLPVCFLWSQESPHEVMEMECSVCHNLEQWKEIHFDHSQTKFPLIGQHRLLRCQDCHVLTNFADVSPNCISCHTDVHQSKLGPWCSACHTPKSWTVLDYTLAHANTTFPLLGAHARLDCGACHFTEIEGEFSLLQSECFSCHEQEYFSVQSPNHAQAGFSKQCENCHSFYAWQPAEFEHDSFFPIFSGAHAGEWSTCRTCHFNSANFKDFTCFSCHEHNKSSMDQKHREVSNYVYDSSACYSCHPRGSGEGSGD